MEWSCNASASENNQNIGSNHELADIFISGGRPIDNHLTFDGPIGRRHLSIGDGRSRDSRQFRRSAHYYRRITLSIGYIFACGIPGSVAMPLLKGRTLAPAKPVVSMGPTDTVYVIPHTGEQFLSKEYPFDDRPIWRRPLWGFRPLRS